MKEVLDALAGLTPGEWILLTVLIIILACFAAFLVVAVARAIRPMRDEKGRWRMDDGRNQPVPVPPGCAYVGDHEQMLKDIKENVFVLYETMLPMLSGIKASLEATKGHANGNVEKAIDEIGEATSKMQKHLVRQVR